MLSSETFGLINSWHFDDLLFHHVGKALLIFDIIMFNINRDTCWKIRRQRPSCRWPANVSEANKISSRHATFLVNPEPPQPVRPPDINTRRRLDALPKTLETESGNAAIADRYVWPFRLLMASAETSRRPICMFIKIYAAPGVIFRIESPACGRASALVMVA